MPLTYNVGLFFKNCIFVLRDLNNVSKEMVLSDEHVSVLSKPIFKGFGRC